MKIADLWHRLIPKNADEKKEQVQLSGEDFAAQNPYYAAVARMYHLAQMTLFGILAGFIILSMLFRSDDITYENFFYLFQDLHAAVDSENISFSTLVYNADERQDFAEFRGGLAVAGESGLTVFSATGRQTLVQTLNMTTPHMLASSQSLLVYEQGGREFSLYNSFTRIYAGKASGDIGCASISDSGYFALATQSDSGSTVSVYDKHSNLKVEHFKTGQTSALALDKEGNWIAFATTDAVNGQYQTKLELYRPESNKLVQSWSFPDFFPLSCSFADSKTIYLTATDRMVVLKTNGEIISETAYPNAIDRVFYSEEGYALLLGDGSLSVYRKDGSMIGRRADSDNIRSVLIGEHSVYMITEFSLIHHNTETGEGTQTDYDFPLQELLWYSEEELLLCTRSKARYIRFNEF